MDSVEYMDSFESIELLYDDSLFFEFLEYISPVSFQSIDTKRAFSLMGKGIYNSVIIITEYDTET